MVSHYHDDVIKWRHFPRYWLFVRGIHRSQFLQLFYSDTVWSLSEVNFCAHVSACVILHYIPARYWLPRFVRLWNFILSCAHTWFKYEWFPIDLAVFIFLLLSANSFCCVLAQWGRLTYICVSEMITLWLNTSRLRQNGCQFAGDGFECMATSHYLNQWRLDYWRIYASPCLNELVALVHAIIRTIVDLLSIEPLVINFNGISMKIQTYSVSKMHLKLTFLCDSANSPHFFVFKSYLPKQNIPHPWPAGK